MQTKNLKSFYVWYIITCHLTAYRASRNRFSAIRLPGPFLDENRSQYYFKHSILSSYFARELVGVMSVQILPT